MNVYIFTAPSVYEKIINIFAHLGLLGNVSHLLVLLCLMHKSRGSSETLRSYWVSVTRQQCHYSEMLPPFTVLQMPSVAVRRAHSHPVLKEHFHTKFQRLKKQTFLLHM
jgi:hypothetical protein